MKKLSLLFAWMLVCCFGAQATTFTVDQGGGGDATTIAGAIALAAADTNGPHTINIVDGGTYTEDVFIANNPSVGGSPNLDGLTLAATPNEATIVAANTASRGTMGLLFTLAGAGGAPDGDGLYIEADGVTLDNLRIVQPGPYLEPVAGHNSALTITADGCTVQNCTIVCDNGSGDEVGLLTIAGDWPTLDATISGGAFAAAGYGAADPVDDLTVTNCVLTGEGDGASSILMASVDFSVGFAVLAGGGAVYFPPLNGTGWSITDCDFTNGDDAAQNAVGIATVSNCHFYQNQDSFATEGGTWTFENCVFEQSRSNEMLHMQADVGLGGGFSTVNVNNSYFCGGANASGLIEVDEGTLNMSGCIINVTDTDTTAGIFYDIDDIDSDIAALAAGAPGPPPPIPAKTQVTLDSCDIYNPDGNAVGILADGARQTGHPDNEIIVIDSIITTGGGAASIQISGATSVGSGTATVTYTDLFTTGTQINDTSTPGWSVTANNNLNVDPGYNGAAACVGSATDAAAFYSYSNTQVASGGSSGGGMGSQGPAPEIANIKTWNLYK